MHQVRLTRPRVQRLSPAGLEALLSGGAVGLGDILIRPALRRDASITLAQHAPDDLVRTLPDDERCGTRRRLGQRQAEDETVQLAQSPPATFGALHAVDMSGVA